jgi:hypothetical protein
MERLTTDPRQRANKKHNNGEVSVLHRFLYLSRGRPGISSSAPTAVWPMSLFISYRGKAGVASGLSLFCVTRRGRVFEV